MASAFRESEEQVPRPQGRDKVGFTGSIKDSVAAVWQGKREAEEGAGS